MSNHQVNRTVDTVMRSHKRKVSQLEALKEGLGLYFDEEKATEIAKEKMKELNPNPVHSQNVLVESIVAKAKKEHTRKVSQFRAIQSDIAQYFPNEEDSTALAAEVMKEFNPNDRSGQAQEVTIERIVDSAVSNHKRKISKVRAVQNELGLIFDADDVNIITRDVMKQVFAQKHGGADYMDEGALEKRQQRADKSRKESIATPNIFGSSASDFMDDDAFEKKQDRQQKHRRDSSIAAPNLFADDYNPDQVYMNNMKQELDDLKDKLRRKDMELDRMKDQIDELSQSKTTLAINSSKSLDQMREFLIKYQRSISRT